MEIRGVGRELDGRNWRRVSTLENDGEWTWSVGSGTSPVCVVLIV